MSIYRREAAYRFSHNFTTAAAAALCAGVTAWGGTGLAHLGGERDLAEDCRYALLERTTTRIVSQATGDLSAFDHSRFPRDKLAANCMVNLRLNKALLTNRSGWTECRSDEHGTAIIVQTLHRRRNASRRSLPTIALVSKTFLPVMPLLRP
ncbi:chromosome transmission fidelity protein [Pseudozyma hubeiensis SY62]|uniref:Chromosome transmission fidelity protein n=1 Tax=Pseudozyma hubeiensis (strain SY62) TaxID=1305764 RepID=R9P145_PSEHS|nr:chromosome transmission fidelity protein [Pseudozyma hubeiensis SY62]GAC94849.1 chromosome transmission fidelity protein [Pseudozyma hubeiensis SY62]